MSQATYDIGTEVKPIDSIDELRYFLNVAIQLEHATIPPYLSALYSIKPGTNLDAGKIIRVVAVEEMLHLTLSANVLNAVDGKMPKLTYAGFTPDYPSRLPSGETDFEVSLGKFSPDAVETFLNIERSRDTRVASNQRFVKRKRHQKSLVPAPLMVFQAAEAMAANASAADYPDIHFYSIGEFYNYILEGIERLETHYQERGDTIFCGNPAWQITPEYYYSGGGEIIPVKDL
ncbi:MAG: hypothetical protein F6K19_50405, partial [Cyanothece sp. SIO1E1]|nr:hypothetical protein [Cyanothece sp. SIO1E1]